MAFVFLAFVLISPVDCIGFGLVCWVVDGFCLDWKFCSVVSEKDGRWKGGRTLGWLVATQKKSNVVVLAGIV